MAEIDPAAGRETARRISDPGGQIFY